MIRPEPNSVMSTAAQWATRVTSIGLEFALPALFGGFLDRRWGTGSLLTILGAILGFLAGMVHILAMARAVGKASPTLRAKPEPPAAPRESTDGPNERIGMS